MNMKKQNEDIMKFNTSLSFLIQLNHFFHAPNLCQWYKSYNLSKYLKAYHLASQSFNADLTFP